MDRTGDADNEAAVVAQEAIAPARRYRQARLLAHLIGRSFSSVIGAAIVFLFLVFAAFGPWIVPYPADGTGAVNLSQMLQPPSLTHWFGTDEMGNDLLSRVVLGTRTSLEIGLIITLGAALIGAPLGIVSGYLGGRTRRVIMSVTDLFLSIPGLVLAIAIVSVLGPGIVNAMIALAIVWWPGYVRLLDAKAQSVKEEAFVEAARSLGASTPRIVFRYLLPSCMSPLIVKASMDMGAAILAASGLGFIGLGARAPDPEWGAMLGVARGYLPQWWWYAFTPGMAIYLSVLGFNLLGDGLRDILDPRTRS
jgi:peptide/nickel transport system permease protein